MCTPAAQCLVEWLVGCGLVDVLGELGTHAPRYSCPQYARSAALYPLSDGSPNSAYRPRLDAYSMLPEGARLSTHRLPKNPSHGRTLEGRSRDP